MRRGLGVEETCLAQNTPVSQIVLLYPGMDGPPALASHTTDGRGGLRGRGLRRRWGRRREHALGAHSGHTRSTNISLPVVSSTLTVPYGHLQALTVAYGGSHVLTGARGGLRELVGTYSDLQKLTVACGGSREFTVSSRTLDVLHVPQPYIIVFLPFYPRMHP